MVAWAGSLLVVWVAAAAGNVHSAAETTEALLRRLPFIHDGPVRRWLSAIPTDVAAGHPAICIAHPARSLGAGEYDDAEAWLQRLDASVADGATEEDRESLYPHVCVYRAMYALAAVDLNVAEDGFRAVVEHDVHGASAPGLYARGLLGIALFLDDRTNRGAAPSPGGLQGP